MPEVKKVEFANSIDLDKTAHYEPSQKDLLCLLSFLYILNNMTMLGCNFFFFNFADVSFVIFCFLHFKN